ncbi:MAG: hypothetical protein ABIU58_11775 [Ramlibacter sp.]
MAVLMTACGGGGGSPGTVTVGGGSSSLPGGTATLAVTDFALFTDKTTVNNNGTDKAQLTVMAVDSNRNVVPGAAVTVTTDQNGIFSPSAGNLTGTDGSYVGTVSIGGDKSDREITLAVTINGTTKKTAVRVQGSRLTLQAVPSSPAPGQTVLLTATLVDSSAKPVPGVPITMSGNASNLQNQVVVTNLLGVATKTFVAPSAPGIYTLTANGNGVSAGDYQLQVFSTSIPVAVIPPGAAPSMSISPNVLAINSPGSTANKATVRFLFVDPQNVPVQNVRVKFIDVTTGLPTVGSSVTSGGNTLYTDASGTATTQYISGQNLSPTNGVTIRACYSPVDFVSSTDCPAFVNATVTIAGQALSVSVGDDNLLQTGPGTYIKRFAVTVADSAGKPVANAPVDISVDLTHYRKGPFTGTASYDLSVVPLDPNVSFPSTTTEPVTVVVTTTGTGTATQTVTTIVSVPVWCANEDRNRNGNVDPGENINNSVDSNGQPTLEPRKSDLLISYDKPTVTTTDANGILVIKTEYSQRFATWLAYKVRVTANVSGSQGLAERLFVTNFIEGDDKNGSFLTAPYGVHSCVSPN